MDEPLRRCAEPAGGIRLLVVRSEAGIQNIKDPRHRVNDLEFPGSVTSNTCSAAAAGTAVFRQRPSKTLHHCFPRPL